MSKNKKMTIRHLKEDRKVWLNLAKTAMKEAEEDAALIRKLRRKK